MFVTPNDIVWYMRCPRRAYHNWGQSYPNWGQSTHILSDVIKTSYLYCARYDRLPTWRQFPTWVDLYSARNMRDATKMERYKEAKGILVRLKEYYDNHYLYQPSLINVPIVIRLKRDIVYRDSIDIVAVEDQIKLCDFIEVATVHSYPGPTMVYNDFVTHVRAWGFWRAVNKRPARFQRICIAPQTIKPLEIGISEEMLEKTEKTVKHIVRGVSEGVWYPSRSAQCIKCPFVEGCTF